MEDLRRIREMLDEHPSWAVHARPTLMAGGGARLEVLRLLVERGATLNEIYRGYRPLHALLQESPHDATEDPDPARVECLNWMLANGADPELSGAWPPARAILIAAFVGSLTYVENLRAAGARIDGFVAAALGDGALLRKSLRRTPGFATERDPTGLSALHCAAGSRLPGFPSFKTAQILLEAGADVKARAKSWDHEIDAVYLAAGAKHGALFQLLLQHGADATEALVPAMWNGNEELAAMAIDSGADPNRAVTSGQPLLNHLIRWGQLKSSMWMLARGANPNLRDKRGWTALHQAASRGNERMVRALLDAGADRTIRDLEGETPLNIAENTGKPKIIALLR